MLAEIGNRARKTHQDFSRMSDSVAFTSTLALAEQSSSDWVTSWLWAGAVPYLGAPAIALVGSYDEVAEGILEFTRAGIWLGRAIIDTKIPTSFSLSKTACIRVANSSGRLGSVQRQCACRTASCKACADEPPRKISGAVRSAPIYGVFSLPFSMW
jgi:hypothetical protein